MNRVENNVLYIFVKYVQLRDQEFYNPFAI